MIMLPIPTESEKNSWVVAWYQTCRIRHGVSDGNCFLARYNLN